VVRPVRPWPDHFFCHDFFFTILCLLKSSVNFRIAPSGQSPSPYNCTSALHGRTTFQKPTTTRDLRSFEIRFEFESAVPIRFDSTVMGRFENFRIGRVCPLLVVVRRLEPLTALSGTVYRLASCMRDHTPVLFNVFEPLRIGMRNL